LTFSKWSDLEKQLKAKVSETLQKEVFEEIRDVEIENINDIVYSVYEPNVYKRRGSSGGIGDRENIQKNMVDDLTMEVTNDTPANLKHKGTDKPLDILIERGHGNPYRYDYPSDGEYMKPRKFTEATINDLKQNKQHIKALKEGLKKRGLSTA
jgi:hypothetical protein